MASHTTHRQRRHDSGRRAPLDGLRARLELLAAERPHRLTFYIFLIAAVIVVAISLPFWIHDTENFFKEVMSEAHGVVLDILIIGWLLFYLRKLGERRLLTNRYREEIEDFLAWRSPEATLRIAGNIRRLNRLGIRSPLKLTEAYLVDARLDSANLDQANLWGADLTDASLPESSLVGANLAGANLRRATLERALLSNADVRGADFTEADLQRAFLGEADMRGANLTSADLQFAAMPRTNLEHARFLGANLRGAHLEMANCRNAIFDGANMHGANLDGADLRGADFTRADLTRADLTGAILDEADDLRTLFEDANTLQGARLDPDVERFLKEELPGLFEQGPANNVT